MLINKSMQNLEKNELYGSKTSSNELIKYKDVRQSLNQRKKSITIN